MSQSDSEELIDDSHNIFLTNEETVETVIDSKTLIIDNPEGMIDAIKNNCKFRHICNGMIVYPDGEYYGMIEFKIDVPKLRYGNTEYEFIFVTSRHKCAWFNVDANIMCLVGPLEFDSHRFIEEKRRFVKFQTIDSTLDFVEIINIDNDQENIIPSDEIPDWMLASLVNNITVIENQI